METARADASLKQGRNEALYIVQANRRECKDVGAHTRCQRSSAVSVGFDVASFWCDEKSGDGYIAFVMEKVAVRELVEQTTAEGKTGSPSRTEMVSARAMLEGVRSRVL